MQLKPNRLFNLYFLHEYTKEHFSIYKADLLSIIKLNRSFLREIIDSVINDEVIVQLIQEQLCNYGRAMRKNRTSESLKLFQKRHN